MRDFIIGIRYYFQAVNFIKTHRLQKLIWGGALLNLLAFVGVGILAVTYAGDLADYLLKTISMHEAVSTWQRFLQFVVNFLIYVIVFLLYLKLYRYLVLIFFSPWLAYVAEKTQELDQHITAPFELKKFMSDIWRGIVIAVRNLVIELGLTIFLLFLSVIIPVLSPFFTIAIFLVESYFIGFAMIDYRNEFFGFKAKDSARMIWNHKGLAFGNGVFFNLMLFVPVIGVLVVPTWSVISAGLAANVVDSSSIPESH